MALQGGGAKQPGALINCEKETHVASVADIWIVPVE